MSTPFSNERVFSCDQVPPPPTGDENPQYYQIPQTTRTVPLTTRTVAYEIPHITATPRYTDIMSITPSVTPLPSNNGAKLWYRILFYIYFVLIQGLDLAVTIAGILVVSDIFDNNNDNNSNVDNNNSNVDQWIIIGMTIAQAISLFLEDLMNGNDIPFKKEAYEGTSKCIDGHTVQYMFDTNNVNGINTLIPVTTNQVGVINFNAEYAASFTYSIVYWSFFICINIIKLGIIVAGILSATNIFELNVIKWIVLGMTFASAVVFTLTSLMNGFKTQFNKQIANKKSVGIPSKLANMFA